jgi:hypothetical protein
MTNLIAEIQALPPHHRIALAAWIIKTDRPSMQALSQAVGSKNLFSERTRREPITVSRKETP